MSRRLGRWSAIVLLLLPLMLLVRVTGCTSEGPPWVRTLVHPDYADSSYLLGVGSCAVGELPESEYREAAQRRAFAEIATQIRTRVTARWQESTHSTQKNSDAVVDTEFLSEKRLASSELLEGVRIVDGYLDTAGGVYYVLAALDIATFAGNLSSRILRSVAELRDLGVRCREARGDRAWGTTVNLFAALGGVKRRIEADLALLRVIDLDAALTCGHHVSVQAPPPPVDFSIDFAVVAGQDQRGLPDYPLENSIVVQASVKPFLAADSASEPVAGLTVLATVDSPGACVEPHRSAADAQGRAAFTVLRIPRQVEPLALSFALDLPGAAAVGLAAQCTVHIPVVNDKTVRLGLAVSLSDRDRKGRRWTLERLATGISALGPVRGRCVVPPGRRTEDVLRQLRGVDVVVFADLKLDLLLFNRTREFVSSEARLRFRLWSPHASTWLWVGEEARAVGLGIDALTATEEALLKAMRAGMGGLRAAVFRLLDVSPARFARHGAEGRPSPGDGDAE